MSRALSGSLRTAWAVLCMAWVGSAAAITGPEMAQWLNQRYRNTAAVCAAQFPAFYCSGVITKVQAPDHAGAFWKHSPLAVVLGSEELAFMRADLPVRAPGKAVGMVLRDGFDAISQGQPYDVLCAYPVSPSLTAGRGGYGCALPSVTHQAQDPSSCGGVGVVDAAGWLAHFRQQGSQPNGQCSFSTQVPSLFAASLQAHRLLAGEALTEPRLRVANWDDTQPARLAVAALFYDTTVAGALRMAQKDQLDYFQATSAWLPIMRLRMADAGGQPFGFDLRDQLYVGYTVAARLNARYQQVTSSCHGGTPSFYCNGVLIRAAEASASFHAWNPSPTSVGRNGVSFTYLRAGSRVARLAGAAGFTFAESAAPVAHPITLRCAYPANAGTSGIPDSCRAFCDTQGVTTAEAWRARYAGNPGSSCAFRPSVDGFALSLEVRAHFSSTDWNEIIIAAWPQNIPTQLPLDSFFYSDGGLANAQFMQRDYAAVTGRYLPVVRMNLAAGGGQVFSFDPQQQTVQGMPVLAITPRENPL